MLITNDLLHYPRFIFNCNDGRCLSTGDLEIFSHIKATGSSYDISSFVPGRNIDITWENENGEQEINTYTVNRIEIHQIKYDLDEPSYGVNSNDCIGVTGKKKKWMMEIYVFLDKIS